MNIPHPLNGQSAPPIFVISLARAESRRAAMRARLDKAGLRYEIVDAVDGATLAAADYGDNILRRDKFRRKFGREILDGEIGCYLSHYRLWQRMVTEKIPSALVLEDDADWDEDLLAVADDIDNLDWSWGVVLLSARRGGIPGRELAPVGDNRQLLLCDRRVPTAAGYVISQMGAWALLQHCREITAPIDIAYSEWWQNEVPFYCVAPPPVRHAEEQSFIYGRSRKTAPLLDRAIASCWRKKDRLHCYMRYLLTSASEERGDDEEEL